MESSIYGGSGVPWNGRVAVFDLDKTLFRGDSFNSFLGHVFREDPRGFIRRIGLLEVRDLAALPRLIWQYKRGGDIDQGGIRALARRALPRILPHGMDLRAGTKSWFDAIGQHQLDRVVVREMVSLRGAGYEIILASSTLDIVGSPIAHQLEIDPRNAIFSPVELTESGGMGEMSAYMQGTKKAEAVEARIAQIEGERGVTADRGKSYLCTDSRSDIKIMGKSRIGNLIAVGGDLDAELKKGGGERIQHHKGAVVIADYIPDGRGNWVPLDVETIPASKLPPGQRVTGLWFAPCQWLIGDMVSYAIYEREFCWPEFKDSFLSMAVFSGAGATGESVSRGFYNFAQRLPFLYAGPDVRGGVFGGAFHFVGSIAGMIGMELYHRRGDFSVKNVLTQAMVQGGSWMVTRGVILGGLKLLGTRLAGNPWIDLAELALFPAAEFLITKWMVDWNYREGVCNA